MKYLALIILTTQLLMSQEVLRTYTGTASQDTLKRATTVAATSEASKVRWVKAVHFESFAQNDTLWLWQTGTSGVQSYLGIWGWTTTVPATPFSVQLDLGIDSTYVIAKRKATSTIGIKYSYR